MKIFTLSLLIVSCVVSLSTAAEPKSPKYNDYARLLNNSPFGKKAPPPVIEAPPVVETKSTLGIMGASKVADGWIVTLVDAKKPSERFMVHSNKGSVNGVSVVSVEQDLNNYRNTTAVVSEGGKTYKVTFDTPTIDKNIANSVKAQKNIAKDKTRRLGSSGGGSERGAEYDKLRKEMMKEAEALRKMRDSGSTGAEYQKRKKELLEKSAEMRSRWRQRRSNDNNSERDQ